MPNLEGADLPISLHPGMMLEREQAPVDDNKLLVDGSKQACEELGKRRRVVRLRRGEAS